MSSPKSPTYNFKVIENVSDEESILYPIGSRLQVSLDSEIRNGWIEIEKGYSESLEHSPPGYFDCIWCGIGKPCICAAGNMKRMINYLKTQDSN